MRAAWGKGQRSPEEEERNYFIYGTGAPSKKQIKEREGLLAAGKLTKAHAAKEIRSVGLLKFIRNCDAHGGQMVSAGRFESEDALRHYLLDPFPWLLMVVYRNDQQHSLTTSAAAHAETVETTSNPLSSASVGEITGL